MKTQQYLTFSLDNWQYGIEANLVQEVLTMPELNLLEQAENNVIGMINLHGQIISIMHLNLLQESQLRQCNLSDHIIVIQYQGLHFGIIIQQVKEVINLDPQEIKTKYFSPESEINTDWISGSYQADSGNINLLDPQMLINHLDTVLPLIWDAQMQLELRALSAEELEQKNLKSSQNCLDFSSPLLVENSQVESFITQTDQELQTPEIPKNFYDLYCPNTSSEEKAIFRQRANQLKLSIETNRVGKLIPLAIIDLGNEYFGVDLKLVRAFFDISNLTPIPCCPSHIVGNMNLRGEVITLVDIRKVLNIPLSKINIGSKAVLVQVDDIVVGLPVERVLDMVELNSLDLSPLPTNPTSFDKQYLKSTTLFEGKILHLLDLPKLFQKGGIAVNEDV
jgi:purine-binding chemotaxis protein CheW